MPDEFFRRAAMAAYDHLRVDAGLITTSNWNFAPTPCPTLEQMRRTAREMELMTLTGLGVPFDTAADE